MRCNICLTKIQKLFQTTSGSQQQDGTRSNSLQKRNFSASISAVVAESSSSMVDAGEVVLPLTVNTTSKPVNQSVTSSIVRQNDNTTIALNDKMATAAEGGTSAMTSEEPFLADLSRGAKVVRGMPPPHSTASQSSLSRQQFAAGSSTASSSGRSGDEPTWERSRMSMRRATTTAPPLAEATRGSRRDDEGDNIDSEKSAVQQRGRVRLNASVLGLYQKNHPSPAGSSLATVRGDGGSGSAAAVRSGVGGPAVGGAFATALRAERVRFKVR